MSDHLPNCALVLLHREFLGNSGRLPFINVLLNEGGLGTGSNICSVIAPTIQVEGGAIIRDWRHLLATGSIIVSSISTALDGTVQGPGDSADRPTHRILALLSCLLRKALAIIIQVVTYLASR